MITIYIQCQDIVEKYADMVYRIAVCRTNHKEDAEDVFQDVFISLIKNADKIENETHLKHWLIRTTINKSKNINMCFWKKHVALDDTAFDNAYISYNNSSEVYDMKVILNSLNKKLRDVVYLYYYEGYSISEISEILNIKTGTVKSRLFNARKKLETKLKEEIND